MSDKKKKIFIGITILVVLGLIIGFQLKQNRKKGAQVKVAEAKIEKIVEKVRAPARIQPVTIVNISANVMGQITHLAVEEGDWVDKGQFLLEIDPATYQSIVDRTKALVKSAEANKELAEANLRHSRLNYERQKELFERNLLSQQDLEIVETEVQVNEARLKSATEEVEQMRASLAEARSNLKKTTITAPMSGTVSQLNVEEGEVAVTGTMNNPGTVLLSIADLTRMEAEAEVDETDVINLELGQEVEIEVDALPDTILTGQVREIANTARIYAQGTDQEVTNFTVKVDIVHHHSKLRPGMSATLSIITATLEEALSIPIQAIVLRQEDDVKKDSREKEATANNADEKKVTITGVFLTKTDEKARGRARLKALFTPVETGISSDTDIQIISGLSPGDEVISGPYKTLLDLKDGAEIQIEDEKDKKDD